MLDQKKIPCCWKNGLTILIHKKSDAGDPGNFRPITLQSSAYKIFSSLLRNRLYSFLEKNNYIEKHHQKGFWPAVDGVAEHTQVLTHILRDAKLHQRAVTVVLLDLKNAFGEIHHNLIATALELHHVPDHIRQTIKNIYTNSRTAVFFNDKVTDFIPVE